LTLHNRRAGGLDARLTLLALTWQVSAAPNVTVIPLALVAPAGAPATEAQAYVAPDDYYQNP
jgi:hypothetical protein